MTSPSRCPPTSSTASTSSTGPPPSAASTPRRRCPRLAEARRRLVFDELLRIQLALVLRKRQLERTAKGIRHELGGELVGRFHALLPFALTEPQRRVIAEIEADLAGPHPMHRLLQGDVGIGKTVVARQRPARRGRRRSPGRVDGADRGAGRAARPQRPSRCSRG